MSRNVLVLVSAFTGYLVMVAGVGTALGDEITDLSRFDRGLIWIGVGFLLMMLAVALVRRSRKGALLIMSGAVVAVGSLGLTHLVGSENTSFFIAMTGGAICIGFLVFGLDAPLDPE